MSVPNRIDQINFANVVLSKVKELKTKKMGKKGYRNERTKEGGEMGGGKRRREIGEGRKGGEGN